MLFFVKNNLYFCALEKTNMDKLKKLSEKKIGSVKTDFERSLSQIIDWQLPLILIKGHRGSGKTTLLLQKAKTLQEKCIYFSLDDIYFETFRLADTIEEFYEDGYRHFFLDEIHRYLHWSKDLKNIYDNYPEIKIIATGSSILEINKGNADLSRRLVSYYLPGLSFREFLQLEHNYLQDPVKLEDILTNHSEIATQINDEIDVLKNFQEFIRVGYYPFFKEGKKVYSQKLRETINLVLDIDIAPFEELSFSTVRNMKKLLFIIGQSVPFTPNISKLAEKLNVTRNTVLKILNLLSQARIISLLRQDTKGISFLQKPEKIYLQNPNLSWVLSNNLPDTGNLRETFFFSQTEVKHNITSSRFGDFMLDDIYTFEIGGASKIATQIKGIPNAFITADDIKGGVGNKIPLWLFGFLY